MKLTEKRGEGVNENLPVVHKPPMNSPEATDDLAQPLTPLQGHHTCGWASRDDERRKITALRCLLLSHNSLTYCKAGRKWKKIRRNRRR